jgi:hypothetical protein
MVSRGHAATAQAQRELCLFWSHENKQPTPLTVTSKKANKLRFLLTRTFYCQTCVRRSTTFWKTVTSELTPAQDCFCSQCEEAAGRAAKVQEKMGKSCGCRAEKPGRKVGLLWRCTAQQAWPQKTVPLPSPCFSGFSCFPSSKRISEAWEIPSLRDWEEAMGYPEGQWHETQQIKVSKTWSYDITLSCLASQDCHVILCDQKDKVTLKVNKFFMQTKQRKCIPKAQSKKCYSHNHIKMSGNKPKEVTGNLTWWGLRRGNRHQSREHTKWIILRNIAFKRFGLLSKFSWSFVNDQCFKEISSQKFIDLLKPLVITYCVLRVTRGPSGINQQKWTLSSSSHGLEKMPGI